LPPEPEEEVEEEAGDGAETKLPVPVERDLSRADALPRYMSEVARHPLLTREEEHRLATEFQKTQDPRLAYRPVTANLRLGEQLADEELRRIFKEKLAEFGKTLTDPKEIYLFEHRLGVHEGEPKTLQQVGDKFGFTRERARQLEARLTDRLRQHLRKELPDFAELSVNPPEDG